MSLTLAVLALGASPALPPSSRWLIEARGQCTLSRDYDSKGMPLTIGLRPYPFSKIEDLVLVLPTAFILSAKGNVAKVAFGSSAPIDTYWGSFGTPDSASRVLSISLDRDTLAALETAPSLTVTIGAAAPITVALTGTKQALARLAACDTAAVRALGIDPAEESGIATPAVPTRDPATLIGADDYPSEALRDESQGVSYVVWAIGPEGRVIDCRVGVSSGDPALDAASCGAIMRRARYRPAIATDGKPVVSHAGRRVNWRVPG